jgi:hypothetical protein
VLACAAVAAGAIVGLWLTYPRTVAVHDAPPQAATMSAGDLPDITTDPSPTFVPPTELADHMSPPPPPEAETNLDDEFLGLLIHDGYSIEDAALAERNGHLACASLAVTHSIYQTHMYMLTLGIEDPFAKELASAGTAVYCPNLPY